MRIMHLFAGDWFDLRYWNRAATEVIMTTSNAEYPERLPVSERVSVEELAWRKGVRPIESAEDLAQDGVFDTDEELDAFLAHVTATRHADLA